MLRSYTRSSKKQRLAGDGKEAYEEREGTVVRSTGSGVKEGVGLNKAGKGLGLSSKGGGKASFQSAGGKKAQAKGGGGKR